MCLGIEGEALSGGHNPGELGPLLVGQFSRFVIDKCVGEIRADLHLFSVKSVAAGRITFPDGIHDLTAQFIPVPGLDLFLHRHIITFHTVGDQLIQPLPVRSPEQFFQLVAEGFDHLAVTLSQSALLVIG